MELVSVNSSNIKQIWYEEDVYISLNRKIPVLRVVFTNGGVYDYYQVPKYLHVGLMKAESKGKYFHKNIKNQFHYEKVK